MNPLIIKARSFARRSGMIRLIHTLRPTRTYEERFHQALVDAVRPGDRVWDVGANVGIYTEQFCRWVGSNGFVVAFEPGPAACSSLRERVKDFTWVRVEQAALGDMEATATFVVTESAVDSHLQAGASDCAADGTSTLVSVWVGDRACERLGGIPNVLKIDVEGYEEEVLRGMHAMLSSPELRSVLVEVHFLKLELRGLADAPVRIERLLRSKGFKTRWTDASHVVGSRL